MYRIYIYGLGQIGTMFLFAFPMGQNPIPLEKKYLRWRPCEFMNIPPGFMVIIIDHDYN